MEDLGPAALIVELIYVFANHEFGHWFIAALFLSMAFDRIVSLVWPTKAKKDNADWLENQRNFLGVDKDIGTKMQVAGYIMIGLTIAKPVALGLENSFGWRGVEGAITTFLVALVFVSKWLALRIFKRRYREGRARRVPLVIKKAWIEANLQMVGFSSRRLRWIAVFAILHSLALSNRFMTDLMALAMILNPSSF